MSPLTIQSNRMPRAGGVPRRGKGRRCAMGGRRRGFGNPRSTPASLSCSNSCRFADRDRVACGVLLSPGSSRCVAAAIRCGTRCCSWEASPRSSWASTHPVSCATVQRSCADGGDGCLRFHRHKEPNRTAAAITSHSGKCTGSHAFIGRVLYHVWVQGMVAPTVTLPS